MKIGRKFLVKLGLVVLIFFLIFFLGYKIPITIQQKIDPISQFNQTFSVNITGNASTIVQSEIDAKLNINGDSNTWDITEASVLLILYQVSVEHNTTISYPGILNSINTSINFTSTTDDDYSMAIYNFVNSNWETGPCQSQSVTANNYYTLWCNITANPTNYNSSEGTVRVMLNSTTDIDQGTLKEEYVQFYIGYSVGYLEVELVLPSTDALNSVVQNSTFLVNATVFCRNAPCGNVNGRVRYNLSSSYPDTPVNTSYGDKPFFVSETPAYAMKACPNNPLNAGDFCNLTWIINASGDIDTAWKIGVLFNSSYSEIQQNHTENATVSITSCTEELSLSWSTIDFGSLLPSTYNNAATGNDNDQYNITNSGTCTMNIWIKGTDLVNQTLGTIIGVGNVSWSNSTNNPLDSFNLTYGYNLLKKELKGGQKVTTYYWLDVPPTFAGNYLGNITFCGNYTGVC